MKAFRFILVGLLVFGNVGAASNWQLHRQSVILDNAYDVPSFIQALGGETCIRNVKAQVVGLSGCTVADLRQRQAMDRGDEPWDYTCQESGSYPVLYIFYDLNVACAKNLGPDGLPIPEWKRHTSSPPTKTSRTS